jgi:hypothetical protein
VGVDRHCGIDVASWGAGATKGGWPRNGAGHRAGNVAGKDRALALNRSLQRADVGRHGLNGPHSDVGRTPTGEVAMDEREFLKGPLKKFLADRGPRPARQRSKDDLTADASDAELPPAGASGFERRRHTRFKVSPMYSHIQVRRSEGDTNAMEGHLYDISVGGVRFELDEPLSDGERVTVEILLPGCQKLIQATGKVVRINDEADDPGPRRMALRFDAFADEESREALARYLGEGWLEQERAA